MNPASPVLCIFKIKLLLLLSQIFFDQIDRRDVYMAEHISAVFL